MATLNRKRLDIGPVSVKHPILKARMLLSGFAMVLMLYFLGSVLVLIPALIFVSEFGSFGWVLTVASLVGVVGLVSYHGYRKTLTSYLEEAQRVTPENAPELSRVFEFVERECADRGMAVPDLYVHPAGAVNAFAIGRRQSGYVVLMDGTLAAFDDAELEAIVAHELAHIDNRDSVLMTIITGLHATIVNFWTWFGYVLKVAVYERRGVVLTPTEKEAVKYDARKRVKYVASPIALLQKSISRHREYIADAEAAEMTDPQNVVSALESLGDVEQDTFDHKVSSSLCIVGKTDGFLARIRSTHPPMEKRIGRVQKLYGGDAFR